jgi:DNA excision repair protein ERCC-2
MRNDEVEATLERLSARTESVLLFAVQGGVFSEGVDYPGDMVIGAFVVGPPLPGFDFERERMKDYYQREYQAGQEYAYTVPAMAKAIQAAGRVIRTDSDKGVIILMDNRFLDASYARTLPADWFHDTPGELVSRSILSDLGDFWRESSR